MRLSQLNPARAAFELVVQMTLLEQCRKVFTPSSARTEYSLMDMVDLNGWLRDFTVASLSFQFVFSLAAYPSSYFNRPVAKG